MNILKSKNIIFLLLIFPAIALAHTGWKQEGYGAFVLNSVKISSTVLTASFDTRTNDVGLSLMNMFATCGENNPSQQFVLGPAGPYKVNGKLVHFREFCVDHGEFYQAASVKGRQYLISLAKKGDVITINRENGTTLHFKSHGFKKVRKKILSQHQQAKSAM